MFSISVLKEPDAGESIEFTASLLSRLRTDDIKDGVQSPLKFHLATQRGKAQFV